MEDWSVGPNVFAQPPVWLVFVSAVIVVASLAAIVRALRG